MSRKWQVIIGSAGLMLISSIAYHYLNVRVSHAMQAAGPDAEPSLIASLQQALAGCGGIVGLVGIIFGWLHKWEASLPAGPLKKVVFATVSQGEQSVLSGLYVKSKNATFRKEIREAAKADNEDNFNAAFPIDPAIDGSAT